MAELNDKALPKLKDIIMQYVTDVNHRYYPYWETVVKTTLENDPGFNKAVDKMRESGYSDQEIMLNAYLWGMRLYLQAEKAVAEMN